MGIQVRGVETTTLRLDNIVDRTNRKVYALMEQAAKETKRRVELQAHRDTGALEKSIRIRKLSRAGRNGRTSFEVFIDPNRRRRRRTRTGAVTRQRVITYARRLESGAWGQSLGPGSRRKAREVKNIDPTLKVGTSFFWRSSMYIEAIYKRKIEKAVREVVRSQRR